MKVWMSVLALVLAFGFVSTAHAAKGGKKGIRGKITSVSDDGKVVVKPGGKNATAEDVTVTTDDKTSVTIDGKDAKVKELKAGLFVQISPAEGTATSIVASTKAPARKADAATKPADSK